jgi:hypothetical protein
VRYSIPRMECYAAGVMAKFHVQLKAYWELGAESVEDATVSGLRPTKMINIFPAEIVGCRMPPTRLLPLFSVEENLVVIPVVIIPNHAPATKFPTNFDERRGTTKSLGVVSLRVLRHRSFAACWSASVRLS